MAAVEQLERELGEDRRALFELRRELESASEDRRASLRARLDALEEAYQTRLTLIVVAGELADACDREELVEIITQVVINVIGCEQLAVLDSRGAGSARRFEVARSMGIEPDTLRGINDEESRLGRQLRTGRLRVLGGGLPPTRIDPRLSACVPLRDGDGPSDEAWGALLLYDLLPQKQGVLSERDHMILRLIHERSSGY